MQTFAGRVWSQVPGRYCGSADRISTHSSEAEAREACEADAACLSIYDQSCDGSGQWRTCRSASGLSTWAQVPGRYCNGANAIATHSTEAEALTCTASQSNASNARPFVAGTMVCDI